MIGIPLLIWRTWATDRQGKAALLQALTAASRHEEQTTADRERRINESFAKAVEQLGSDKLETRLGGIYTLERISQEKESEREYWPIMETLTAYVARARATMAAAAGSPPGQHRGQNGRRKHARRTAGKRG